RARTHNRTPLSLTTPESHAEPLPRGGENRRTKPIDAQVLSRVHARVLSPVHASRFGGVASTLPQNQDRANFGSPASSNSTSCFPRSHASRERGPTPASVKVSWTTANAKLGVPSSFVSLARYLLIEVCRAFRLFNLVRGAPLP